MSRLPHAAFQKLKFVYDGIAYANAAFWIFCTAGIEKNTLGIRDVSFNAMEKVGILNQLEREFDPKAMTNEAQLIFTCFTMSLIALAGAIAAAINIVDAVKNPVVGVAKKLVLASDGFSYANAVAWLIWITLTATNAGHTRQITLDAMVKVGALTELETRLDPTAGIRAAQLISGCAIMFPFALRHIVSDVIKVSGAINRLFCRGNQMPAEISSGMSDSQSPLIMQAATV